MPSSKELNVDELAEIFMLASSDKLNLGQLPLPEVLSEITSDVTYV